MLKKVKQTWKDKATGEDKSMNKMKVMGKLMDKDESMTFVCLTDKGLETRNVKYNDKVTGEEKNFDAGSVFCKIEGDEDENSGFVADFTGQALKEMIFFIKKNPLSVGTNFVVTKAFFENKQTGATYPIIRVSSSSQNVKAPSIVLETPKLVIEEIHVDDKGYEYTETEEALIKTVLEQGADIDTLMYNLKIFKEKDESSVKDLDKERFEVRLK